MSERVLHFTLGPVQGFIADARRTRDLWAGSFLLSWLSGQAMAALTRAGGKILFPAVKEDALFAAIRGQGGAPYVGSLPNRFKADVSKVQGDSGQICRDAVLKAWNGLADKVWDRFLADIADKGAQTTDIWKRQVENFWEMAWVEGVPDGNDSRWLDLRKNWRNQLAPDEPGDLCRLMGRYQELSGYFRIGGGKQQAAFWEAMAAVKGISPLDLQQDERLCAIALIKRLFPLIAKEVIGWEPGEGLVDIRHWPSVSYIAAVPWLKAAEQKLQNSDHSTYWEQADKNVSDGFMGEFHTKVFNLPKNGFFKLDGHLLHQDGIAAWPVEGLAQGEDSRKTLKEGLKMVNDALGASASEFYAVLVMDGDGIGARIGTQAEQISQGLAKFTTAVQAYFTPQDNGNPANGVLIYAGGDDVLALVPVDSALTAARALRKMYQDAFKPVTDFTLSGAIVFAQYKIPLRSVLASAHQYLDEVAKEANGRNSLAIAVKKPGGISYDFVSKWDDGAVEALAQVARHGRDYSSSFFYNLRDRLAPLFADGFRETATRHSDAEGNEESREDDDLIRAMITSEYKKQFGKEALKTMDIGPAVERMVTLGTIHGTGAGFYDFDAALVARFMGTESRRQHVAPEGEKP